MKTFSLHSLSRCGPTMRPLPQNVSQLDGNKWLWHLSPASFMAKLELGGQIINWQGFRFTSLLSHTYENLIRQAAALFLSAVRQAVRGDNGNRNTVGCSRERCSEPSFKGTLGTFFFYLKVIVPKTYSQFTDVWEEEWRFSHWYSAPSWPHIVLQL